MPDSDAWGSPTTRTDSTETPRIDVDTFNRFPSTDLPFCVTMGIAAEDVGFGWGRLRWTYDANYRGHQTLSADQS
ncbi:MAG: hypothetical protein R2706_10855 [Acidimicrobiales bacterium]